MNKDDFIPKATLQAFIKQNNPDFKYTEEFVNTLLSVSTEYIDVLANQANELCQQNGKKTIQADFIYKALDSLNIDQRQDDLKALQSQVISERNKKNETLNRQRSQQYEFAEEQRIQHEQQKKIHGLSLNPDLIQEVIPKIQKTCISSDFESEDDD